MRFKDKIIEEIEMNNGDKVIMTGHRTESFYSSFTFLSGRFDGEIIASGGMKIPARKLVKILRNRQLKKIKFSEDDRFSVHFNVIMEVDKYKLRYDPINIMYHVSGVILKDDKDDFAYEVRDLINEKLPNRRLKRYFNKKFLKEDPVSFKYIEKEDFDDEYDVEIDNKIVKFL